MTDYQDLFNGCVCTGKNSDRTSSKSYIDGNWVEAASGKTFAVHNPANGEFIADVPDMDEADTAKAIAAADNAFDKWSKLLASERSEVLYKWYEEIIANGDVLAELLTREQGKPFAEAKGEIIYGASFIKFYAEEAVRIYGQTIPSHKADARIIILRQPVGISAAITPWNFPSAMITRKVAPAMAVGCTVIVKPAEDTPLSAIALATLGEKAGIPAGVLNIVTTSNAAKVGSTLTASSKVRALSFTGSTEVGRILMQQSAANIKKVGFELGGNAPFIVFADADIDSAVAGAMICKYRNSGQTCVCANRILIHSSVYEEFCNKLAAKVAELKVGNGLDEGVNQGPLINDAAVQKVERHLEDAVAKGAKIIAGGKRHALGGTFFEPTIVVDMTSDMLTSSEEVFGPVAAIYRFDNDDEAIAMANSTEYGLAAYFYARDMARIMKVAESLESGMVGINEGIVSTALAPFGGVKQSGIGREGSNMGTEEYLETKYMLLGGL